MKYSITIIHAILGGGVAQIVPFILRDLENDVLNISKQLPIFYVDLQVIKSN